MLNQRTLERQFEGAARGRAFTSGRAAPGAAAAAFSG
jgi:hypothetical protein